MLYIYSLKCRFFKILIYLFSISVFAQQDPQFSQYMFTHAYMNPAYVGINNQTEILGLYRSQWTGLKATNDGVSGVPYSQMLSASTKIRAINSGVGLYVVNDILGPQSNLYIRGSYAYHIDISENTKLGFGISAGIYRAGIDANKLKPNQDSDPTIDFIKSYPNNTTFDLGGGIWLQNKNFYAGFSLNHINQPSLYKFSKSSINYESDLYRHYYFTAGYNARLNENWMLAPSIITKGDLKKFSNLQFDFSALAIYNNYKFWGGLSYRHLDALVAILGIGLLKNNALRVGYSFDLTIIGNAAKAGTSHEIMASYFIPVKELIPKPVIRTPRFRY
ncbi:MAG: type IX secretion system membrane protein PorP/SprF [Bacteroidetes bacterium]|nr:MAG: type IX secretion system membrane protein PorP/SprF [Bacteroidota bacterium]